MPLLLDRCGFNPVSGGTGDFVVSSALTGYMTPATAGAVDTKTYRYVAESADLSQWEIGIGTYAVGTTTLARTTINFSSNANAKVTFTNPPQVRITALLEDIANPNTATSFTAPQSSAVTALTSSSAVDASLHQHWSANVNGSTFTVSNPTSPITGAYYALYVTFTTSNSLAFGTNFKTTGYVATAVAGKNDFLLFRYNGTNFELVGFRYDVGT